MKRILSLFLCVVLVVCAFSGVTSAFAVTGSATVKVLTEKNLYTKDEYIYAEVALTEASELVALQFDVEYDTSLLTLMSVTRNVEVFDSVEFTEDLTLPTNTIVASTGDTSVVENTGAIATLTFKVKSDVKKHSTQITLSNAVGVNNSAQSFTPALERKDLTICGHINRTWEPIYDEETQGSTGKKKDICSDCDTVFSIVTTSYPMLNNVEWTVKNAFYTGKEITPTVIGKYTEETGVVYTLKQDVNFKITNLQNNKKTGTATFSVVGFSGGGYGGMKNGLTFKIVKATVSGVKSTYTYKGSQLKPSSGVSVKTGKTLKKDVDYTLSYSTNKYPGYGYVYVKGIGDYSGTIKKSFIIVPGKPTWYKCYSPSSKKLTVAAKKNSKVSGYQIQISTSSKFKSPKTYTGSSYKKTFTSLSKRKYYYARIRSYKTVGGKKYYGAWTSTKKVKTK